MLILARHGRTDHNAQGRLIGRLDRPLDEVGEAQAAALARAIADDAAARGVAVGTVITSPLQRTRQTAEIIAAAVGVGVIADERWVELDYGELDGRVLSEVPAEIWAAWRADAGFAPPGGESLADLRLRVEAALLALTRGDEAGVDVHRDDVVVVSHVSPIKAAVTWALGGGDELTWRFHLSPASICRIALGPQGPVVHTVNEAAHLAT